MLGHGIVLLVIDVLRVDIIWDANTSAGVLQGLHIGGGIQRQSGRRGG